MKCIFLLVIPLLVACGVDVPGGAVHDPSWLADATGSAGDAADSAGVPLGDASTDAATGAASDAAGASSWYAFWQQTRRLSHNPSPFGDAWQASRTSTVGLVKVDWQGNDGVAQLHTCAVVNNPIFDSQLTYPPDFINAIGEQVVVLHRQGQTIAQDAHTEWLGLKAGYAGAMPAVGQGQDSAIVDDDGDGHPGVTVYIDAPFLGEQALYVVQRSTTNWQGALGQDGAITASPEAKVEQVTVGASSSVLVTAADDKPLPGEVPVQLRWQPVPQDLNCAKLLENAKQLTQMPWPP